MFFFYVFSYIIIVYVQETKLNVIVMNDSKSH